MNLIKSHAGAPDFFVVSIPRDEIKFLVIRDSVAGDKDQSGVPILGFLVQRVQFIENLILRGIFIHQSAHLRIRVVTALLRRYNGGEVARVFCSEFQVGDGLVVILGDSDG